MASSYVRRLVVLRCPLKLWTISHCFIAPAARCRGGLESLVFEKLARLPCCLASLWSGLTLHVLCRQCVVCSAKLGLMCATLVNTDPR